MKKIIALFSLLLIGTLSYTIVQRKFKPAVPDRFSFIHEEEATPEEFFEEDMTVTGTDFEPKDEEPTGTNQSLYF